MQSVKPEKLTREAFAPFGTVVEAAAGDQPVPINAGTCLKFADLARPDCAAAEGEPSIHIYRARPLPKPIIIKSFERHCLGSQTFFPLSGRPYLVVVAPPGTFRHDEIRVFRADGSQGIQYLRGTWHHFCLALDAESEFLVIDRFSSTPDCEEVHLSSEQQFVIAL